MKKVGTPALNIIITLRTNRQTGFDLCSLTDGVCVNFFEQTTFEMQINILTLPNKRAYSKLKHKIEFKAKIKVDFLKTFFQDFMLLTQLRL